MRAEQRRLRGAWLTVPLAGSVPLSPRLSAVAALILAFTPLAANNVQARPAGCPGQPCCANSPSALSRPAGASIVAGFGIRRNPLTMSTIFHPGIDYRLPAGEPVRSLGAGRVMRVSDAGPQGAFIVIDHGQAVVAHYAHLGRIKVSLGRCIRAGQVLGLVSSAAGIRGRVVHIEIRRNGILVDPLPVIGQRYAQSSTDAPMRPAFRETAESGREVPLDCEGERRQLVSIAAALRAELQAVPRIPLSHEPVNPEGRLLMCRNIQRTIANDEDVLAHWRRCSGTPQQQADLVEMIGNRKVEFEQKGCDAITR